jgi:hypothetical protein
MHKHLHNLLRSEEFLPSHLFSIMLYTFVSAIIAYILGQLIETIFRHETPPLGESTQSFFEMSTIYLTLTTLLQCLAISVGVFLIHKITSLFFLLLGLTKTAYIGISHGRSTFAATNVVIVIVLVHTIKTFNSRLLTVLNRLKKI